MKKQKIIESTRNEIVLCAVCQQKIGLRTSDIANGISLAWFDPYVKGVKYHKTIKGAYTCHVCLSQKRKDEITATLKEYQEKEEKQNNP